ncbi:hypothetical protein F4677DRAFT_44766 [Hypoxylon crocopeplum]|nr:hypothetical protein F4677DRAFT_44766 [Hypoxylon crocopeplum]
MATLGEADRRFSPSEASSYRAHHTQTCELRRASAHTHTHHMHTHYTRAHQIWFVTVTHPVHQIPSCQSSICEQEGHPPPFTSAMHLASKFPTEPRDNLRTCVPYLLDVWGRSVSKGTDRTSYEEGGGRKKRRGGKEARNSKDSLQRRYIFNAGIVSLNNLAYGPRPISSQQSTSITTCHFPAYTNLHILTSIHIHIYINIHYF